jgi:hypothetical protein
MVSALAEAATRANASIVIVLRIGQLRTFFVIACDKREAFTQGIESDEAIHASASRGMDCFASLAMTMSYCLPATFCLP